MNTIADRAAGPEGAAVPPSAVHTPSADRSASALYRRVWRWHFYAGLVCLPFLVMLALTGALYLYKEPIESLVYASLRQVDAAPGAPLGAEALVARARSVEPGDAVPYVPPPAPGRSAEVGIRTTEGTVSVYLDPVTGRVLGHLRDDRKLMQLVRQIHSLAIAGTVANHAIEIVAGWAIVLVVSGVFLWWPRGRSGGVWSLRGRPAQRTWWRDLHAVTGIAASAAIVFLAVTGMPWSAFWGEQFGRLTTAWGVGLPQYLWGPGPASTPPLAALGDGPWSLAQAVLPPSTAPAGHGGGPAAVSHVGPGDPVPAVTRAAPVAPGALAATTAPAGHAGHGGTATGGADASIPSIGLDEALRRFERLGLPPETPVQLPQGPQGAYTALRFPDDVRGERVVHLDRYTGAVLADVGYADFGIAGRLTEWGVSLHTGRQFGVVNQLVMLAGCLSIVALAVSAVVMWWKRRPRGRLAAPPRHAGDRAAAGAIAVAMLLGLLYPLLGASMLVVLLLDTVVPQRWHERFGL